MTRFRLCGAVMLGASMLVALSAGGCTSSSESAKRDTLTADVGHYPPPPGGITKPRVGVPAFKVQGQGSFSGHDVDDLAADQMTTLLDQTERFDVIERAQLSKLLDEQNLEGIVKPGELAKPGQVRGVDYLLIGRVTNLRVKQESHDTGFGLAQLGNIAGGADVKHKDVSIKTECGVDIRLVDPTTGVVMVSNFSEFNRTDSASALGVDILGASANADASMNISEDDKGKILRLALDDAVKKSLPKIDKFLTSGTVKHGNGNGGNAPMSSGGNAPMNTSGGGGNMNMPAGASGAVAAKHFCPNCGKEVADGAKFCPSCGAKLSN
jgi:curli biogenesis system outer membrane secretion channel CsgG